MTMNEPQKNHRSPLAPGEVRIHRVGDRTFQVMHVAGGSFTQASVRVSGQPSTVLLTSQWGYRAIDAYADAIEQAESDRTDALDDADGTAFIGPASGRVWPRPCVREDGSHASHLQAVDGMNCDPSNPTAEDERVTTAQRAVFGSPGPRTMALRQQQLGRVQHPAEIDEQTDDPAQLLAIIRNDLRRYVPGGGEQYLDRYLAAVERSTPQRATAMGLPIWQHACGVVDHSGPERPHPDQCDSCRRFRPLTSDPWRPLYTLPDGV